MKNDEKGYVRRPLLFQIIFIVGVVVCVTATAMLFVEKEFKATSVTVTGLTYYSEEDFLNKISSAPARKNTLRFRAEQYLDGEKRIPYIEKYDYSIKGNHEIQIQVYEKILIGCIKVMGQYVYFDKDGYVTESSAERLDHIPLVKGISYDRIVMYEKLDEQKDKLYGIILNISKLIREYELPAASITFDSRGNVELELLELTVKLGKREAYEIPLQKLSEIFPKISDRALTVDLSEYQGGKEDIIARPKKE